MRKTKWLLFSGISGILTLVCFIGGIIAHYNRPSRAEYELVKYIGGYAAAMGGVDAVVFTGGIGENNPHYRARVGKKLEFIGVKVDEAVNEGAKRNGKEVDISAPDAKVKMLVIPTNEELMIARDTMELCAK